MGDEYIFVEGAGKDEGVFIKESTITSVTFDKEKASAVIFTEGEDMGHLVVGALAVYQLYDYFYQKSKLKLFRDKK